MPTDPDLIRHRLIDLETQSAAFHDPEHPHGQTHTSEIADNLLARARLQSVAGSPPEVLLVELVRRAMLQLVALEKRRLSGDFSNIVAEAFLARRTVGDRVPDTRPATITLAALIEQYDTEFIAGEDITLKAMKKNRAALAIIRRYFGGDTDVGQIDRDAFVAFRDMIAKLPPNVTKKFGPDADLKIVAEQNGVDGGAALNRETQTRYLRLLSHLSEFARDRRFAAHNDAANLRPEGKATPANARRRPFTREQLGTIFAAPIYTGCVDDERGYAKAGPNHPRRSRFWVPLIALFTGLRMEEVFQLTPAHIQIARDGEPFLLIAPGMQVKTENGFREVPLHRELLWIGFMEFVAKRKRNGETVLLFDDVPPAADGYHSTNFSKRFATFFDACGIKNDARRTCFHSFRHNFRDALRQPNANPDFLREAGGMGIARNQRHLRRRHSCPFDAVANRRHRL